MQSLVAKYVYNNKQPFCDKIRLQDIIKKGKKKKHLNFKRKKNLKRFDNKKQKQSGIK